MRTYVKTHVSEKYGRHFMIDTDMNFVSAPSLGIFGYDETQIDYVGSWTDLEGVVLQDLFDIYRKLVYDYHRDGSDAVPLMDRTHHLVNANSPHNDGWTKKFHQEELDKIDREIVSQLESEADDPMGIGK